jgi:hypothetical protein
MVEIHDRHCGIIKSVAIMLVPRLLSADKKKHSVDVRSGLKDQAKNDPYFISTIITGDESSQGLELPTTTITFSFSFLFF